MVKTFDRLVTVAKKPASAPQTARIQQSKVTGAPETGSVINLDRFNLNDRGNWLRAIESSHPDETASLDELLEQIAQYQGQIERTMQSAEAQSTIYAYAIGSRLDVIEEARLFEKCGHSNLTDFIKAGEIKRPGGTSITTRQVWAYRKVTRGLNEFLSIAEQLKDGVELAAPLRKKLSEISAQVNTDVVEQFREQYVEGIAKVLELGVSKLEQVYRLPDSVAYSGLIAGGQLQIAEKLVPVHEVTFSELRSAVSQAAKQSRQPNAKPIDVIGETLKEIEASVKKLSKHRKKLDPVHVQRILAVVKSLDEMILAD
jgi:hypothetical protein